MKSYLKMLKCIVSVSIVDNFIKKLIKKVNIFYNSICIGVFIFEKNIFFFKKII